MRWTPPNRDSLHAWTPGTNMRISITTFQSEEGHWKAYLHIRVSQAISWTHRIIRSLSVACVTKHPVNPGYGGSLTTKKTKSARKSRIGIGRLTCHGSEKRPEGDETRTPTNDAEDWKNNRQTTVPIPHSPCPYREDRCWVPFITRYHSIRRVKVQKIKPTFGCCKSNDRNYWKENKFPSTSWYCRMAGQSYEPPVV